MSKQTTHSFSPNYVDTVITPRSSDIGGLEVQRLLPSRSRRMVGPFVFIDRMGPKFMTPETPLEVAPHPHIGLSTLTYLFDGEIVHRDSLGFQQTIEPGAVNLMTAGRGIVHSERSDPSSLRSGHTLFGMQIWMALPKTLEESDPAFLHIPEERLPIGEETNTTFRVIAGTFQGVRSSVSLPWETLYVDVSLEQSASLSVPSYYEERAVYLDSGVIEIEGQTVEAGTMLVLKSGKEVTLRAVGSARVLVLGGAAMDGPRHIWWNFVSSSKDRIEQAKSDWINGQFPNVPGDDAYTPLPG